MTSWNLLFFFRRQRLRRLCRLPGCPTGSVSVAGSSGSACVICYALPQNPLVKPAELACTVQAQHKPSTAQTSCTQCSAAAQVDPTHPPRDPHIVSFARKALHKISPAPPPPPSAPRASTPAVSLAPTSLPRRPPPASPACPAPPPSPPRPPASCARTGHIWTIWAARPARPGRSQAARSALRIRRRLLSLPRRHLPARRRLLRLRGVRERVCPGLCPDRKPGLLPGLCGSHIPSLFVRHVYRGRETGRARESEGGREGGRKRFLQAQCLKVRLPNRLSLSSECANKLPLVRAGSSAIRASSPQLKLSVRRVFGARLPSKKSSRVLAFP